MIDWPDELLLARWWVNGKAIVAEKGGRNILKSMSRKMELTSEMIVTFNYPTSLGAVKEGDKIALQVLYAPDGFDFDPEAMLLQESVRWRVSAPVLSNKIEFPVTKEMIAAHEKALKE